MSLISQTNMQTDAISLALYDFERGNLPASKLLFLAAKTAQSTASFTRLVEYAKARFEARAEKKHLLLQRFAEQELQLAKEASKPLSLPNQDNCLVTLPDVPRLRIFHFLPDKSLYALSSVCQQLRTVTFDALYRRAGLLGKKLSMLLEGKDWNQLAQFLKYCPPISEPVSLSITNLQWIRLPEAMRKIARKISTIHSVTIIGKELSVDSARYVLGACRTIHTLNLAQASFTRGMIRDLDTIPTDIAAPDDAFTGACQ